MSTRPERSDPTYRAPSMDESIVDFDKPPVSEVVCGIGFAEPRGFSTPHMGLFWRTVLEEFPVAEVKDVITPPGETHAIRVSNVPPPPRFFLRSEDRSELIQVQENRFLYNWLKTDDDKPYPRYKKVITRFHEFRKRFERFLADYGFGEIAHRELRLEYVNHIPEGEGWEHPADINRIFPGFKYRRRERRYLKPPMDFDIRSRHPVAYENSRLDVSIRTGCKRAGENSEQRIFIFQLTVVGDVSDPAEEEMQAWFDMAREAINLSFLDLTSSNAQAKIWGIHEHR